MLCESHPYCKMCQQSILFHCYVVFHWVNLPYFIYSFSCHKLFGLFPAFGNYEKSCYGHSCTCILVDIRAHFFLKNGNVGSISIYLSIWINTDNFLKWLYQTALTLSQPTLAPTLDISQINLPVLLSEFIPALLSALTSLLIPNCPALALLSYKKVDLEPQKSCESTLMFQS